MSRDGGSIKAVAQGDDVAGLPDADDPQEDRNRGNERAIAPSITQVNRGFQVTSDGVNKCSRRPPSTDPACSCARMAANGSPCAGDTIGDYAVAASDAAGQREPRGFGRLERATSGRTPLELTTRSGSAATENLRRRSALPLTT